MMTDFENQVLGDLKGISEQLDVIENDMDRQEQVLDYLQRIVEALETIRMLWTDRLDEY
jgi:hypothetical protein